MFCLLLSWFFPGAQATDVTHSHLCQRPIFSALQSYYLVIRNLQEDFQIDFIVQNLVLKMKKNQEESYKNNSFWVLEQRQRPAFSWPNATKSLPP